jgi:hypothetical protein
MASKRNRVSCHMQDHMPFAVVGGNSVANVNGKKVRARVYPWGAVNIEDETVSDFAYLRDVLIQYVGKAFLRLHHALLHVISTVPTCAMSSFSKYVRKTFLRDTFHLLC